MKKLIASLAAAAVMLLAGPTFADSPLPNVDSAPRFMLYAQKSLGHASRGLPLNETRRSTWALGLKLQREFGVRDFAGFSMAAPRVASLLDFRFTPGDRRGASLNGLNFDSASGEEHKTLKRTAAVLAVSVGILCVTGNKPCKGGGKDNGDDGQTSPTPQ